MKTRRTLNLTLTIVFLCITGCSVRIVNLTPMKMPASSSGIYKLKALADIGQSKVFPDSLEAFVVIDGKQYPMTQQPYNGYLFEYKYRPPLEESLFRFYYVLNYITKKSNQTPVFRQTTSDIHQVELIHSISLQMDKQRAAVDTQVSIYGSQLTRKDQVLANGIPCQTSFISSQELEFTVPEVRPNFDYTVEVRTSRGLIKVGSLHIDAANPLKVLPQKLKLKSGQPQALAFMLDYPAPTGGLYVNVTTDIPDSIIMPEVLIPEGSRTVSVTIDSNNIGDGNLFIKAGNLPEIVVPVTIR